MPLPCPDPLNHPPPETFNHLINLVAWAKTCMLLAAATPPSSPERTRGLEELRRAVNEPRHLTDEILHSSQTLPQALLVDLRTCELAIPRLEAGAVLRAHNTGPSPKNT